jgi:hypothetical protein
MSRFAGFMLVAALLTGSVTAALADPPPLSSAQAEDGVKGLALRWYAQMQAGQIDRTQLAAAYSAQLTDDAVKEMSHNANLYGASPVSAEILQSRTIADQKFYLVKLVFPRGDAASLLIGFDAQGKITGISFVSMAGD